MPSIYIACLASYNAGIPHGAWFDLEGADVDDIQKAIVKVLRSSSEPDAEEYAIHDYDDIPSSFGEYPDLQAIIDYKDGLENHGEAWRVYCGYVGIEYATPEGFEDVYLGEYPSKEDYAQELFEQRHDIPEYLAHYIDWQAVVRDMSCSDYYFAETTTVAHDRCYVFQSC